MDRFDALRWLDEHTPESCARTEISQPERIGKGWSRVTGQDGLVLYHNDASGLRKLSMPHLPCDLNLGIESYISKDYKTEASVVDLLAGATAAQFDVCSSVNCVTYRNNLNKIIGTVFDRDRGWKIDATSVQNILCLEIVKDIQREDVAMKLGYQFEAKCSGDYSANPNEEYGMLVKTKLNDMKILIGAEIDGYESMQPLAHSALPPMESLRELKTYKPPRHPGQFKTLYKLKAPKWWIQSYLVGVPEIILGAKDDNGFAYDIHRVATRDLPRLSSQQGHSWSPDQALQFGGAVLSWMHAVARKNEEQSIRFEYVPVSKQITVVKLQDNALTVRVKDALS